MLASKWCVRRDSHCARACLVSEGRGQRWKEEAKRDRACGVARPVVYTGGARRGKGGRRRVTAWATGYQAGFGLAFRKASARTMRQADVLRDFVMRRAAA